MRAFSGLVIFLAGGLNVFSSAALAEIDSMTQKLCILQSATMLPSIPGLSINSASASSIEKMIGVRSVTESVFSQRSAERVIDEFGGSSADVYERVRRSFASGDYIGGTQIVTEFVAKEVSVALSVNVGFTAAKQTADLEFHCLRLSSGEVRVIRRGITK